MAYSPITKASSYFNTKLYTGNATARTISGIGFQPDWVWGKSRTNTENNSLFDAVRGAGYDIKSDATNAQSSNTGITAFNSDGYVLGTADSLNSNSQNFVTWNWKANGQGSSNTDGSINTTYTSVNTTSGFSMSTYTGTGANADVGHGLGKIPKIVLVKKTNSTGAWRMYTAMTGNTSQLALNTTDAPDSGNTSMWNSTTPTANLFYLGTHPDVNTSGSTYIAYCFSEIQGYSAFGKYRGNANASDGTFVNCGFRPSMVIQKRLDGAEPWFMFDDKRQGFNPENEYLLANSTDAEGTSNRVDLLSNGFKLMTTDGGNNANGGPYLYMAFGQTLVGSNNMPANAR